MAVLMKHPELGDSQCIEVEEPAVPHYARSGWQVVASESDAPKPEPARRRTKKESETQ